MKKLSFLIAATVLMVNFCSANILRVGYPGTPLANVDYTTFNDANNAASDGDTVQIYGSVSTGYVTKRLVIVGFGYNFDANANLQAIGTDAPSSINNLYFWEGSSGSVATGLSGYFQIEPGVPGTNEGLVGVTNVTFNRCSGTFILNNLGSWSGYNYGPISNIKIIDCVVFGGGMYYDASYIGSIATTNIQIYNSIISSFNMYKTASSIAVINCVQATNGYSNTLFLNDASALVKNCILQYSNYTANTNSVYESNLFLESNPGVAIPGSNNKWGQTYSDVFTENGNGNINAGYPYTADFTENYFTLKTGSPAINAGFDSNNQPTDCGIFGGDAAYRYKMSGVPALPAIYKLTAPTNSATTNPYNVTISVRSNN